MMSLHDRLDRIAGPAADPTPAQADADLTRARRALTRRRAVQKLSVSAVAAVALAGAVTWGAGPDAAPQPAAPIAATRLVAYQGAQPQGFTIDKVPAGWEIQGGGLGNLTIAPAGMADQEPDSFVGKIVIMLQSVDDTSTPTGTSLQVGGRPAVFNAPEGGGDTRNLWVRQPDGVWMLVQIWDASDWTQPELVEFAGGIHVQPGAQRGHG